MTVPLRSIEETYSSSVAALRETIARLFKERQLDAMEVACLQLAHATLNHPEHCVYAAVHLAHAERTEASLRFFELACPLGDADPAFLHQAGELSLAAGRLPEAYRYLSRLVCMRSGEPYYRERLVSCLHRIVVEMMTSVPTLAYGPIAAMVDAAEVLPPSSTLRASGANRAVHLLAMTPGGSALTQWICRTVQDRCAPNVKAGPFAGMTVPDRSKCPPAFLLGCLEPQLIPHIEAAVERGYDHLLNVGSAEGYYAVGLARRLPRLRVTGWDLLPEMQAACLELARANGVADRIGMLGKASSNDLVAHHRPGTRTLVIMDVEGAEIDLLSEDVIGHLAGADYIIECHDCADPSITATLLRRFAATHTCTVVGEAHNMPDGVPELAGLPPIARWMALCEMRPHPIGWLVALARTSPSQQ